jgi:uncharacterized protein YbaP (TraB family)
MRVSACVCAALALLLVPTLALALPPVWVVRDKDSTITLFGSVHLLPPGVDWRPPALKDALAQADDVWFEAPMDPAGQAQLSQAAQDHGYLKDGEHLLLMLSPKGRQRLDWAAKTLDLAIDQLDRMQPWYAELNVELAMFNKLGANSSDGVEKQLWAGLSPSAKRVAFETPAEQVGFFADAPTKEQVASLELTLKEIGDAQHDYQDLLKAWLAGDVDRLNKREVQPLRKAAPRLYARLVQQRNARWVQALEARLKGSGHTVVIVGTGHLVGPDGLPAQLRADGYEVTGPR